VRARIRLLSNSTIEDADEQLPVGVRDVHRWVIEDLKAGTTVADSLQVLSKSLVDRARWSNLVTSKRSPGPNAAIALASAFLAVTVPLIFSAKTFSASPAFNVVICASADCPSVLTLAYWY
jgi:hypothetical protein